MKTNSITAVSISVLEIPFDKPIASALGTYIGSDYVLVELTTKQNITGTGFCMSLDRRGTKAVVSYLEEELVPLVIGLEITDPRSLWSKMWSVNKARMRGGVGVHALSAIDTAVWDAYAISKNISLSSMLGKKIDEVPVYGSGGWLSLSDKELIKEGENYRKLGISAYKIKIGGERDKERLSLLKEEMGDHFDIYVDANQSFSVTEAIETAKWLRDFEVKWFEEPVLSDCPWELEAVASNSKVPIAAGENVYFRWGFEDLCQRKAALYLQPDIGRCGGVTEWIRIAELADNYELQLTSHLLHEISVSLISPFDCGFAVEYMNFFKDNPYTEDFSVKNGKIKIPSAPGHGVQFSEKAKQKYQC
jgi:L-alanine-DL-glutamate epimerase-like enolase superfamily enzyme